MNFLLDVHIPLRLSKLLIDDGHDVVRAATDCATWSDKRLIDLAIAEQRVIVTEDSDFSELIFGQGHDAPPSIFYLQAAPDTLADLFDQVRLVIESDRFADQMVVIRRTTIRYRAFPGKHHNG